MHCLDEQWDVKHISSALHERAHAEPKAMERQAQPLL